MKAKNCLLILSYIFLSITARGLTAAVETSRSFQLIENRREPRDNVVDSFADVDQGNEKQGYVNCPSSGQHFFPHPYHCSQFIECHNGLSTVVTCPPGLHFTPGSGFCDIPGNCVDSSPTTIAKPEGGDPVGECPPSNGASVDFLTDSVDNTVYYVCNWGLPIQMFCPSGLHFNPTLNVCG